MSSYNRDNPHCVINHLYCPPTYRDQSHSIQTQLLQKLYLGTLWKIIFIPPLDTIHRYNIQYTYCSGATCIKLCIDSWLKLCGFTKPEISISIIFRFIKLCVQRVQFHKSQSLRNWVHMHKPHFHYSLLVINGCRRTEPAVYISGHWVLLQSVQLSVKQKRRKPTVLDRRGLPTAAVITHSCVAL